jgi:ABC-type uncharacterized transport system auxiliary subunit
MRRAVCVLVALSAAGCLSGLGGGGGAPEPRYYALTAPQATSQGRQGALSIAVEELRADAPYDERRIVYRLSRHRLAYYEDDQWVAVPGLLVADSLRRAYQASGRFAMVLSEANVDAAAILSGRVLAFEEVMEGRARAGHLSVELALRDAENGRILWTRRLTERVALTRPTRESLAAALSRAVARVAATTADELAAAAAKVAAP